MYFQKYQNAFSNAWFNIDLELITNHFIISSYSKIINNPEIFYKISLKKSNNPFHSNICQNWNHPKRRYSTKKRSGIECTCLHVYYNCRKNDHKIHQYPQFAASNASNWLTETNVTIISWINMITISSSRSISYLNIEH